MESNSQIENVESTMTTTTANPSRIINVKSINISDVKIELAHVTQEHIDKENQGSIELQPIESISRRIDTQPMSIRDENVTELCEVSFDSPTIGENQVVQSTNFIRFNNRRLNKNLINLTGLFLIIVLIIPIPFSLMYLIYTGNDVEIFYMMAYVLYCCLAVGMPSIYFMSNQKHLMIALKNLPC